MRLRDCAGVSLVEMLISMTVLMLTLTGVATLLIQNTKMNKSQQMTAEVQANARMSLALVVQKLRSGGWDPMNVGLAAVNLDADLADDVSEIEILADLDSDGVTISPFEQIMVRHTGGQIVWRTDALSSFNVLADNISNDADGDGVPEPMFVPDSTVSPTRIAVQVTAQSPAVDPVTGIFLRYTVGSDVALRGSL